MSEFTCDSCGGAIVYMDPVILVLDGVRTAERALSGNEVRDVHSFHHPDCYPPDADGWPTLEAISG